MGSPAAKELLYSNTLRSTFIDHAIALAKSWQARPVVVTRRDKTALNDYLVTNYQNQIKVKFIESSVEWADTCLQSIDLLSEHNVLLLPDTQFSPTDIGARLLDALAHCELAAATFNPDSLETWGALAQTNSGALICEKPKGPIPPALRNSIPIAQAKAWGLLAFRKERASELFSKISRSHEEQGSWQQIQCSFRELSLTHFADLTRGSSAKAT